MTVATTYTEWQKIGVKPGQSPYNRTSPALVSLYRYMNKRWGGKYLGGFGIRKIKGTDIYSVHSWGAAIDWRYQHPGAGRVTCVEVIIPWLIANSAQLGIQAIHDYRGSRIWRANRSGDKNGGWRKQPNGGAMGAAWANYLHIEVNRRQWADGRSVEEKLAKTVETPTFDPGHGGFGDWTKASKPEVRRGATGDVVKYLQGALRNAGEGLTVDGSFGPQTERRVKRFQRNNGLAPTGVVDKATWRAIDKVAK